MLPAILNQFAGRNGIFAGARGLMAGQSSDVSIVPMADFILPLNDLGAGAVDTSVLRGVGSPTFVRATTATTILSNGLIASVGSGVARSCYSPAGVYLGYLAEQASTNLALQSEDFATTWTVSQAAVVTNQTTAPDGNNTADKLNELATTNTHFTKQAFTKAASAITYTASIYAKQAERSWIWCSVDDGVNGTAKWFNIGNGTVDGGTTTFGTGFTSVTTTIFPAANGFYRCVIMFTTTASATLNVNWAISTGAGIQSYLGVVSTGLYVWGAQLEQNAFVTSYIPTTTGAVARNADVLTYPVAGNIDGSNGTCYLEVAGTAVRRNDRLLDAGASNTPELYIQATADKLSIFDGTTESADSTFLASASIQKVASVWGGGRMGTAIGGIVGAGVSFDGSMNLGTSISLGVGGSGLHMNGTLKNVCIWQQALTSSQFQAITT